MAAMSLPPSGWEALGERPLFCGTLFPDLPNEMTAVAVTQTAPNPLPLAISQGKLGSHVSEFPACLADWGVVRGDGDSFWPKRYKRKTAGKC